MKLREFIYQYAKGNRTKARSIIAKAIGVSEVTVKAWENGLRNPSPKYIKQIEELTNGKVTKYDLRPDIYEKPEL